MPPIRSARPPSCTSTTGKPTSSTRIAGRTPTRWMAGQQPITRLYPAVQRAAKCPAEEDSNNAPRRVRASTLRQGLQAADRRRPGLRLPPGGARLTRRTSSAPARRSSRCRRASSSSATRRRPAGKDGKEPPDPDRWWVIKDNPALSGTDIKNPEQNFDQRGGGEPDRHVRLHGQGPQGVPGHHRQIAQRGVGQLAAGRRSGDLLPALRDRARRRARLRALHQLPARTRTGSTASTGAQISGGFTITSAQDLAKILQIGALPIKLELISRSQVSATPGRPGARPGPRGRHRRPR